MFLAGCSFNCEFGDDTVSNGTETVPDEPAESGQEANSYEGNGFAVGYPEDWIYETPEENVVIISGAEGTEAYDATVNIQTLQWGLAYHTFNDFYEEYKAQIEGADGIISDLGHEDFIQDGVQFDTAGFTAEYTRDGTVFNQLVIALDRDDGYFYQINYTAPQQIFEQYEDAAFTILDSFKILSLENQADALRDENNGEDKVINFSDANLEQAIREEINKPEGDIYVSDVSGITELDLSSRDIGDISELAFFVSLEWLSLYNNRVEDITALGSLTKLEHLDLEFNEVEDISVLSNITGLKTLAMWDNQVKDISSLANLTQLEELRLKNNRVHDISYIADLVNLNYLNLEGNRIEDIGPLENLTELRSLVLAGNNISDYSVIDELPYMERSLYE